MAEYVRQIEVHVLVDTNKATYRLDLPDLDSLDEIAPAVDEFVSDLRATIP